MNQLIEKISRYVEELFETHPPIFLYHDLHHTRDVVNIIEEIADNSGINHEEKELLVIAAWFHDAGYPENIPLHEEKSAELAETYLKEINYPPDKIEIIKHLILSTKIPQNPKTVPEKVICDADIAYIGMNDFLNRISLLRTEWEQTLDQKYNDSDWLKKNIGFIEANSFHTDYAKNKFGDIRKKNLATLKQMAEQTNN